MNYKLIMLPNPILVSDEEIEKGDWFYYYSHGKFNMYMCEGVVGKSLVVQNKESSCWSDYSKKIIAGIEGSPKLYLSDIAEEIGWVDVEKKSWEIVNQMSKLEGHYEKLAASWGCINGFKAAQSLNEKKWVDNDMIDFHNFIFNHPNQFLKMGEYLEEFKKSRKPKEYKVECIQEGNTIKVTKIL